MPRQTSRTTCFTPPSAILGRLARSLQRLRDLVRNSDYIREDDSKLPSKDSKWMKRDGRPLETISNMEAMHGVKTRGQSSSIQ